MQDQVLSRQCVTPAMKPDSDLGENESKSRISYSPDQSNRGVSVISPAPAMRSVQPNPMAPRYLSPA